MTICFNSTNKVTQGPTVFPITFATIVGRAIKSLSLWRLQEGERIGVLNLLLGCTTITNTVTTQFSLRSIRVLGMLLIILWALSPVAAKPHCVSLPSKLLPLGTRQRNSIWR
jgi:hypothetical protein